MVEHLEHIARIVQLSGHVPKPRTCATQRWLQMWESLTLWGNVY